MSLVFCPDVSLADWIANSGESWLRLTRFGPPGFDSYARVRLIPDPAFDGQRENDVDWQPEWGNELDHLAALLNALAVHTSTPDDCYVCIWEGYGDRPHSGDTASAPSTDFGELLSRGVELATIRWTAAGVPPPSGPQVRIPNRNYFLFRGAIADLCPPAADLWVGDTRLPMARPPAFIWPADRAWCTACDVDLHYIGIGASDRAVGMLLTNPNLDAVAADPTARQPEYR